MKILIADDHAIVRKGIIQLLEREFSGVEICEASNGSEALKRVADNNWELIILDISMPLKNGIETLKQIRALNIQAPVLILSMQPEEQYAVRSFKAGASGFLNKESASAELIAAVHKVLSGGKYFSALTEEKLINSLTEQKGKDEVSLLSNREMQILQLIASGKTVTEIAEEIKLSITTVSTYRSRIMDKLMLNNNAELIKYALDNKII